MFYQLERLRGESAEENTRLRKDLEKSKEEAREWALRTEMCRLQAKEETKQQSCRLSEQLGEMQKKQETEVCGTISSVKWQELIPVGIHPEAKVLGMKLSAFKGGTIRNFL